MSNLLLFGLFAGLILPLEGMLLHAAEIPEPNATRWELTPQGGVTWQPQVGAAHQDHIEMAGKQVGLILRYGVDDKGMLVSTRQVIWPLLRFFPYDTRTHLIQKFEAACEPGLLINHQPVTGTKLTRVTLEGLVRFEGMLAGPEQLRIKRTVFPSTDKPLVLERNEITNTGNVALTLEVKATPTRTETDPKKGVDGAYVVTTAVDGAGEFTLAPGQSAVFTLLISARKVDAPELTVDSSVEEQARLARVGRALAEMRLETPEPELNTAFGLAKIRATESIFATKIGLLHSPGGVYFAAIWANDQAEYSGPFFAMLADPDASEAGLNAYRQYAKRLNPDFKPLPAAIVAEGARDKSPVGDRGDMAMLAYGAARFALARGDQNIAKELWPLIEWNLEYCRRKLTADGVVASDSDELENRFPAGKANLCTSCLYYDALISAGYLAGDVGLSEDKVQAYREQAQALRASIEKYFGAEVEGFATYRYFDKSWPGPSKGHAHYADEPDHLRAWICVPLAMGIFERAPATLEALFSPKLWTVNGLATEAGKQTFWDRSTLYGLRGAFAAGDTKRALGYLRYYTNRRLRGDHVPYPVEADPEGDQRHLSAESALYCRVFTEGVFGLRPTGLHSFTLQPRLPEGWSSMALRDVHAFGSTFDLVVTRAGAQLQVVFKPVGGPAQVQKIATDQVLTFKW